MTQILWKWLLGSLLAVLLSACASTPTTPMALGSEGLPPPSADDTNAESSTYTYRVGAQDVLEISVFGVPDLSRTVRVNTNGEISLPLIGSMQASGDTIPDLQTIITDKLADGYMQDPQVSIFVKEFVSQQVTVNGSVNKPGIYPLTGKTSLLQALALAGGTAEMAQLDRVVIFRTVEGKRMGAVFDMEKITTGQTPDPQIYTGDIINVSQSGSKNLWDKFVKSAPALGFFYLIL
jgi:polysaccharide export outer membrane protein